jgi:hypothetical protein
MLTDHSPLQVRVFTDRQAAARWLGVAAEAADAMSASNLPLHALLTILLALAYVRKKKGNSA